MKPIKSLLSACAAASLLFALAPDASAQANYPSRPIRLLIPFAPGGGVDVVARVVGQKLGENLGQTILVESKPGAGGGIAVNELMRSEPDGYTLLVTTSSHATLPILNKLSWHPTRDFTPIANIYIYMLVMATNAASTSMFKDFPSFLKYARANPGKLSWGSSGIGGPQHLAGEQFAKLAGVKMVHIPYRGNAPMGQALLANQVQLVFDTPTLQMPNIQAGKLTALAVTGERRLPKLPDTPTVRETGLVDYVNEGRIFVIGPKGLPAAIQTKLNAAFVAALDAKVVRDRLTGFGLTVPEGRANTTDSVTKHIEDFRTTYGRLIEELKIGAN